MIKKENLSAFYFFKTKKFSIFFLQELSLIVLYSKSDFLLLQQLIKQRLPEKIPESWPESKYCDFSTLTRCEDVAACAFSRAVSRRGANSSAVQKKENRKKVEVKQILHNRANDQVDNTVYKYSEQQ